MFPFSRMTDPQPTPEAKKWMMSSGLMPPTRDTEKAPVIPGPAPRVSINGTPFRLPHHDARSLH